MVGGRIVFVENKTTEFKREYVEDIKNTIVAFANSDGGTLYIGVNDDGIACGVNNVDDRSEERRVRKECRCRGSPGD